ncbi:MAG: amidohydrolase family protein [Flammeovirgaceae bacterium]
MKIYILFLLILLDTALFAQSQKGSILLKGGNVLTITKGNLEKTDVLIIDGIIKEIGTNLTAPSGVQVLDVTGEYVMPGIIDAHSHLALEAINEYTNPITPEVWTGDVLNPLDVNMYRALAGGVTISHAMHGSANAIGGQCVTIKHRYGTTNPKELIMEGAPRTIKFALGENPTRVHGRDNNILPKTRMGVESVIRRAFEDGKAYQKKWDEYEKLKTAYENAVKSKKSNNLTAPVPPKYDLRASTLADILAGKILIHCHSYRADEILMLMNICKEYGIKKICFQHANEAFKVAPELAAFGATCSVFADWWAYKFEVYYSTAYNASILTKNGVITSINSDSEELIRHLYHEAAKTQKYGGLTDEEALKLITINPAIQLGIDHRVGSIEVGKDGDIAVFHNHPLSIYTLPEYTIVDGIIRFDMRKDADDQRILVPADGAIEPTSIIHQTGNQTHQNCMQNVEGTWWMKEW